MDSMPPRINLPAIPQQDAEPAPPRSPLLPERTDFLEGDAPAAAKVEAFLARALEATGTDAPTTAAALVPWICDVLLSNHSVKGYGRDLMDFGVPIATEKKTTIFPGDSSPKRWFPRTAKPLCRDRAIPWDLYSR